MNRCPETTGTGLGRVVVLAEKDKVEMEDEIRDKVSPTGRTRIICRTGTPLDLTDLEIVNPHAARSIIILAPESDDPDSWSPSSDGSARGYSAIPLNWTNGSPPIAAN